MITTNPLWKLVENTIDIINTEDLSKDMVCIGKGKLVVEETMKKPLVKDIEVAGLTLFSEKTEGKPMDSEDIIIGGISQYTPKTFAKKVQITDEALEDEEYEKVINPSKRLVAMAAKTKDLDVANVFLNATTSTALGGFYKEVLASTTHALPSGGTFSNYLNGGVGMTPSVQAVSQMRHMATAMVGPNGLIDSVELTGVTFPDTQLEIWKIITGNDKSVGNNYNDINTAKSLNLDLIPVKHYDASSTTFWGCLTNAENGIRYFSRRKGAGNTWVDPDGMVANHGYSYRSAIGWSNCRFFILGAT